MAESFTFPKKGHWTPARFCENMYTGLHKVSKFEINTTKPERGQTVVLIFIFFQIKDLEAVAEDLTRTKDEFEGHNNDLDSQLQKLEAANTSLKGSLESLKEQTDGLEGQLKQFEELQEAIGKYAEKNNTDMSEALAKQTEMFNTLKTLMNDNAQTLLNQVATDMEYFDDEEGMTEEEFNKW